MPISHSEQSILTCPQCGHEFGAEVWLVLDAQERPDLQQALLAGQLNQVACPHCGTAGAAGAPLLYHDGAARQLIFAAPEGAPEYELRETARELHTLLLSNLAEQQQRPYLGDVQISDGLDGLRRRLEKEIRRRGQRAEGSVGRALRGRQKAEGSVGRTLRGRQKAEGSQSVGGGQQINLQ